jgi:sarcosine oxidase, subunit gamma
VPDVLTPQSALGTGLAAPRGIRLAERTNLGKIELRGDPTERAYMTGVGRCLDLLLPTEPSTSASQGSVTVLWLGPDRWLVTCPGTDTVFFMSTLREALAEVHAAIVDVSDGRTALRLAGPDARDVLAKGCPLDLHPRAFAAGSCAQTLLAKAAVLVHLVEDDPRSGPAFDLYVARSFAHYLWSWLEDAGREYGVQVEPSD